MAEIILRIPHPDHGVGSRQLIINGVDVSQDVYDDFELVKVGDAPAQEVGLRVTYALSTLRLGDEDVIVTDQFDTIAWRVAQQVSSQAEVS